MDQDTKAQKDPFAWSTDEFVQCWKSLPDKNIFFGLLAAWVVLFHLWGHCQFNYTNIPSLFAWMWGAWSTEMLDSEHGKVIPIAVMVILWIKREKILGSITGVWWPALIPLMVALVIHLIGFLIQQPRVSIIALFLGLYSLAGLVWGVRTLRVSFFPFVLFAFCMPLGTFVEKLTFSLRLFATEITGWFCNNILAIPVVRLGTQLSDPSGNYNYDVAAACSGIRSMFMLLAITIIFGMLLFKNYWKRAAIISLAIPLSIFCNVLRLLAIVVASQAFGASAGHYVHEYFGFVTYAVAIGVMMLVGHFLQEKKPVAAT